MPVEVFMPKMSDHMEAGEIIRWLVEEGDPVEQGQVIMELMTDKVVAELESPASGVLKGIRPGAQAGASVPVGETFAFIAQPDESVPVLPALAPVTTGDAAAAPKDATSSPAQRTHEPESTRATPVARRVAKELGIDLALVQGSGPQGRITDVDVRAFAEAARPQPARADRRASPVARRVARDLGVDLSAVKGSGPDGAVREEDVRASAGAGQAPPPAPAGAAGAEWLPLNAIQRLTGQRMLESIHAVPQFGLSVGVDTTNFLWLREALMEQIVAETGERLSITALLVRIVAAALRRHPRANGSYDNGRVVLHPCINLGIAMCTEDGLVVPVIQNADRKSLAEVTRELKSFHDKTLTLRFSAEDLSGGTFTISNLGMFGIDSFDAIINPPQSAILAVGRILKTPVGMPDGTIALRPMLNLTLKVDHRALDGVQAAKFLVEIRELIEKPYFLLHREA